MVFNWPVRHAHLALSWELGFRCGTKGRPYSCPWWADRDAFYLAYMQGRGIKISAIKHAIKVAKASRDRHDPAATAGWNGMIDEVPAIKQE
jgi:hypothetical protein